MSDGTLEVSTSFLWATGIEDTFIPQARPGLRALDEYELTQHYQLWKRDFDLVAETGVTTLRWGLPWYRVQPAPDKWEWAWIDQALDYAVNVKGLTPILDLMHYGTPLWLENSFINASYPERVADYAQAVATRYKSLVRYYTPLNEPMVNADMCGRKGEWPPYLRGDDGYVKLTLALAKGICLTTQALQAAQPGAVIVQVEALWHTFTHDVALRERVAHHNARQYLCFDLTTGRVGHEYLLLDYLYTHGATEADFDWFRRNAVTYDFLGANFYPWSYTEWKLKADGSPQRVMPQARGETLAIVLREAQERYHLPLIVTETSANADQTGRARWMDETLAAVRQLRRDGLPVIGYTWFPLFTMIDWAYRQGRRPLKHYLLHLGLYDSAFDARGVLRRRKTPLVKRYQQHMAQSMPPIGN